MYRKVASSFSAQIFSLMVSFAERFLLVGILVRAWGIELYADWVVLMAAAGLFALGDMGMQIYFGNSLQHAKSHKEPLRFQRMVRLSIWSYFVVCSALLVTGLLTAFALWYWNFLSIREFPSTDALFIYFFLMVAQVLLVARASISQIYRGQGDYVRGIMINTLVFLLTTLILAFAAWQGAAPLVLALLYFLSSLFLGWGGMIWDLRYKYPDITLGLSRPDKLELQEIFAQSKWYFFQQGAPILWLQIPIVILAATGLAGLPVVILTVQRTITNLVRMLAQQLATSVGVELSNLYHVGNHEALKKQLPAMGRIVSSLSGAIAGGVSLFAPPFIFFWTGKQNLYDPLILGLLLVPIVLTAPVLSLSMLLTLSNIPKPVSIARFLQILLGLGFGTLLIFPYGVLGLVIGLVIGEVVAIGIFLPLLARSHLNISLRRYFAVTFFMLAVALLWSGFVAWLAISAIPPENMVRFLLAGAIWFAAGLAPVLYFALAKEQRKRVKQISTEIFFMVVSVIKTGSRN